eukprot:6173299-Pleurochrysis_carterae.AAC.2
MRCPDFLLERERASAAQSNRHRRRNKSLSSSLWRVLSRQPNVYQISLNRAPGLPETRQLHRIIFNNVASSDSVARGLIRAPQ